ERVNLDQQPPILKPKSDINNAQEWFGLFFRVVSALAFGGCGGAVFLQHGFEGAMKVDIFKRLINGEEISKEEHEVRKAGIKKYLDDEAAKTAANDAPPADNPNENISQLGGALAGTPAFIASGLLYTISALEAYELLFEVLPGAIK